MPIQLLWAAAVQPGRAAGIRLPLDTPELVEVQERIQAHCSQVYQVGAVVVVQETPRRMEVRARRGPPEGGARTKTLPAVVVEAWEGREEGPPEALAETTALAGSMEVRESKIPLQEPPSSTRVVVVAVVRTEQAGLAV